MSLPPDLDARRRVVEERLRSTLVEASAGTGKTHTIIEAIVEVCVRREPRIPLTRVAAVTFTEKAAGELQDRLRSRLEEVAAEAGKQGDAARMSLEEIDRAQVGTIHAFCSSLLRERPIEAGLIPDFTMILPEASVALASEVFEEWWRREVEERPDGALGRALSAGMRIAGGEKETTLRSLAADLYDKRARLEDARFPSAGPDSVLADRLRLQERARELRRSAEARHHPVAATLGDIVGWLDRLPDDLEGMRNARPAAPVISFRAGGKDEAIDEWREKEYKVFLDALEDSRHWPLLVDLLHRLVDEPGGYLDSVAKRKRRESFMDFDDLLLAARDLLRRSPSARAYFRTRYSLLVVDEFQDTDPIQMEIVLRLAHSEGDGQDWAALAPEPGRLLLVGDPKQSIYRFRRADIETYSKVRDLLQAHRETFVANRRSVPSILEWVNRIFGEAMGERPEAYESAYSPVEPWGIRPEAAERRVVYLDPPPDWRTDEDKWRKTEADKISALLRDAIEKRKLAVDDGRPARPGDIAVLVKSNESVGLFQESLAQVGVDAVTEGGLDFFRREEPAAVLAALRAIDNPDDGIALYAALKSFLFALSDEELFLAREGGAFFDFRRPEASAGPLREGLEILLSLHRSRETQPASETALDLLAATGALVKARARRIGGLQAQANLHQVVNLARGLAASSASFGEVVRGLLAIGTADASEPRAFEESTDAVKVLTVHKAKGLEFPVVVLAGFGAGPRPGSDGLLIPSRTGPWGASIRIGAETIASPGLEAIRRADAEREAAEIRRLLYVGATRARDWLLLSRWRKITESQKGIRDSIDRSSLASLGPTFLSGEPAHLVEQRASYPESLRSAPRRRKADPSAARALQEEIADLNRRAERWKATVSAALRPAGGSRSPDAEYSGAESADAPSVAARIGSAVHRSMEIVIQGGDLRTAVARAALEAGLSPSRRSDVAAMVETLLRSPVISANARRIPELPVLFRSPEDGALVEGKIDLLVEGEGGWTILDYKTDRLDGLRGAAEIRKHFESYRPQLREYRTALEILGIPVVRTCVISARSGELFDLS